MHRQTYWFYPWKRQLLSAKLKRISCPRSSFFPQCLRGSVTPTYPRTSFMWISAVSITVTGHSHAEAAARSSCGWGGLRLTCNGFPPGPAGRQSGVAIRYRSNRRAMERADVQGSNAPRTDIEPSTGASRSQASEQPVVQNCSRESVKRHCGSWNRTSLWPMHIARRKTRRNARHYPAKFVGRRWLLQVSIRHKYPFGKIDNLTDIRCLIWQVPTKAVLWWPETSGCYVLNES